MARADGGDTAEGRREEASFSRQREGAALGSAWLGFRKSSFPTSAQRTLRFAEQVTVVESFFRKGSRHMWSPCVLTGPSGLQGAVRCWAAAGSRLRTQRRSRSFFRRKLKIFTGQNDNTFLERSVERWKWKILSFYTVNMWNELSLTKWPL